MSVGRALARAARFVGAKIAAGYHAIDPDVRKHFAETPLLAPTLIGRRNAPIEARPDDGYRPIVCVHGLGGHRQNFLPLRAALYLDGRTRFYSLAYDPASLDEAAKGLIEAVKEIARVNQLAEDAGIDLVAHSMGGIVCRLALLDAGFARRVARFVTIGTPHQGTLAARFAATARALDLRPGSSLLARLVSQSPWPPSLPPLVALYSDADIMMLPADCATLPGADNRHVAGISHNGFLLRPRALREIRRALA